MTKVNSAVRVYVDAAIEKGPKQRLPIIIGFKYGAGRVLGRVPQTGLVLRCQFAVPGDSTTRYEYQRTAAPVFRGNPGCAEPIATHAAQLLAQVSDASNAGLLCTTQCSAVPVRRTVGRCEN
jgi:hypothetical protein